MGNKIVKSSSRLDTKKAIQENENAAFSENKSSMGIKQNTFHNTTFDLIVKKNQCRWTEYLNFKQNEISTKRYWLSDKDMQNLWIDCSEQINLHKWKGNSLKLTIGGSAISDKCLGSFSKKIAKDYPNIRRLSLIIASCPNITGEFLEFNELGTLRNLKSFSLEIIDCKKFKNERIEIIGSQIAKHLTHLLDLTIVFGSLENVGNAAIQKFGNKIKKSLKQIQQLNLKFSNCRSLNDSSLEIVGPIIPINLRHLSLDFGYCDKVTGKSLGLQKVGKSLSNLTSLALSFNCCTRIDQNNLSSLILESFAHIINLKCLILTLSWTDNGLNILKTEISKQLHSLERLELNFSSCLQITDKGLDTLGSLLAENFRNIQKMKLIFMHCELITKKGLRNLASKLGKNMIGLKELSLDFRFCKNIDMKEEKKIKLLLNSIPSFSFEA